MDPPSYKHYVARGYDAEKGVRLARKWLVDYERRCLNGSDEIDDSLSRAASEYLSLSSYRVEERIAELKSRLPGVDAERSYVIDREDARNAVSPAITDKF